MKKPILNFLLIAAVSPLLIQCASRSDLDDVRYQLRIVNKKIEDMKSTTVDQLQKRQAAASGQVEQLEQDILKLRGQLEETYHLNQRLNEQNKELEQSITSVAKQGALKREEALERLEKIQKEKEMQLSEMNNKLQLQQESVKAIQQARVKDAERRVKEAAIAAQLAKSRTKAANAAVKYKGTVRHIKATRKKVKNSVVAPAPKPRVVKSSKSNSPLAKQTPAARKQTSSPTNTSATNNFQKGQALYNSKKYSKALEMFEQISMNSSNQQKVDARFMMGECLFKQKEYDKAIMQFQKIISLHSGHAKAPAAMLRQGMAFEKLSDNDTAKVIYKKLLKKHGTSAEATRAQEKLNKL